MLVFILLTLMLFFYFQLSPFYNWVVFFYCSAIKNLFYHNILILYSICIIMPPPSVTGEVYCFPRRQLIFSFGRRVIYHSKKGFWKYIPNSILSVCLSLCKQVFKRIAGFSLFILNLQCCISMDSFRRALQTNGKHFFQISNSFTNFWPKTVFFLQKRARREYWLNCNVLYINGFVSTSSTN